MIIKSIILLVFLTIPVIIFSQESETKAFIVVQNEFPDYVQYTMKILPKHKDNLFNIVLLQTDSTGKEVILSDPSIKISSVLYNKGHQMGDGKVYLSYYVEINYNDKWNDDYIEINDCSGSKVLEASVRLKTKRLYILRIYNKDKLLFEERITN